MGEKEGHQFGCFEVFKGKKQTLEPQHFHWFFVLLKMDSLSTCGFGVWEQALALHKHEIES